MLIILRWLVPEMEEGVVHKGERGGGGEGSIRVSAFLLDVFASFHSFKCRCFKTETSHNTLPSINRGR